MGGRSLVLDRLGKLQSSFRLRSQINWLSEARQRGSSRNIRGFRWISINKEVQDFEAACSDLQKQFSSFLPFWLLDFVTHHCSDGTGSAMMFVKYLLIYSNLNASKPPDPESIPSLATKNACQRVSPYIMSYCSFLFQLKYFPYSKQKGNCFSYPKTWRPF